MINCFIHTGMEVVNEVKRVMSGKGLPQKRKSFNDSCCSNFSVDRRSKKKKKIALNYCTSKGSLPRWRES